MIIQVRGSSCSGKTTAVTNLLRLYPPVAELWELGWNKRSTKLAAYLLPGDLLICGGYLPSTRTGGLDSFGSGRTDRVWAWLRWQCRRHRFVIFEGLMASLVIGRSQELMEDLVEASAPSLPMLFAFLDTPLEVVLERLMTRTGGEGPTGKGVNLKDTGHVSWKRIQKLHRGFIELGLPVMSLPWQTAPEALHAILVQGGWRPDGPSGVLPMAPSDEWYARCAREDLERGRTETSADGDRVRRPRRQRKSPEPSVPLLTLDDRLDQLLGGP